MSSSNKWSMKGGYFETCNCEVECPCIFTSDPSHGDCTVLVAWHIDEGKFNDTNLNGLNVVGAFHSPGNMLKTKWKAALYLDQKASSEQANALTRVFGGQEGGPPATLASLIGEIVGVKNARIEYSAEGKHRSVRIPQIAEAEIEAIEGQGGAEVQLQNHPIAVSPGNVAVVSKSKKLSIHDLGFDVELSNRSGLYAPFKYGSA
ncbi:MAG: DUF1326 domain-containing protein [Nitrososphaerales archaeon]